ncbi:hypothetical protein BDP27DRAFT_1341826 [Rhodocollybia butyracea]|uniref:Uncharacterized protein n=1 Tax=Rhodocollybia butyracea TaxID=206335 RepID=A0A9P5P952_9AGAR|nr:hypothetical protein BDP27DRAFT_1341826 [Rhodocollybia butyracea]
MGRWMCSCCYTATLNLCAKAICMSVPKQPYPAIPTSSIELDPNMTKSTGTSCLVELSPATGFQVLLAKVEQVCDNKHSPWSLPTGETS